VSRFGAVTKTATIETITVDVDGTAVTAVVLIRFTNTALIALARIQTCSVRALVECIASAAMVIVTTATTTVVAVGMVETAADARRTTNIALIASASTPTSKDSTRAYQNVQSWPGKVTERATIVITSAAATGTVATVVSKRTRN